MMSKESTAYQMIIHRSHSAINALWEDYEDTAETLTEKNNQFIRYDTPNDPVSFFFEHKSTSLAVNYQFQAAETLSALRGIKNWENIIPPLVVKCMNGAEQFFGAEVMEKYEEAFEIKTTFTNANTKDFDVNPFDHLHVSIGMTITSLSANDAVELLCILQYIAFLADQELASIVKLANNDAGGYDFIFGEA